MRTYEQKLNADLDWALREGSMHFEEKNAVHETLRRITQRLNDLAIPYAVVGGMAMFAHGFRRFTEDVDLLVTRESMNRIMAELEGLGYVKPFQASTTKLRDTSTGVQIEFLITGGFPGDGKPKPVAFPDPAAVSVEIGGARYIGLQPLVELKLASGTAAHRMKDLGDVQELIKTLRLPRELSQQLNPFVRARYEELWDAVANEPTDE
jgi:hypothetical protein